MLRRLLSGGAAALLIVALAAPLHAQIDPELLAGMQARSIGPAGMSGRIADIEAVESNPNIVYVGASAGGIWKSLNGGLTWEPIFDDQPVHAIGSIEVFQASPDIVWVGTGEGNPRNSVSGTGWGVFKSMDGGRNWEHLGLASTERIHRIALNPSNPDVAYVGAMGSMWKPNPERGVFKTEDGGATWRKILYVNENTGVADMEIDPTNPNKLIVAMWDYQRWPWYFRSGGPGTGLYMTVDGGRNWKQLTPEDGLPEGNLGRIGLAIAPSDPNIVYALIEAKEQNALYKSMDGGHTWRLASTDDNIGNRPFYYFDLRVDPKDANRVYSLHSLVTLSTDGGSSFEQLVTWGSAHPDHHAMWINPNDPSHIYEGNDGGVYVSNDHGQTWRFAANLPLAQYYHINVDMETPYNIYGGMQDNGSWRGPSSVWENGGIRNLHWEEVGFGDGFATLAIPGDAMAGYAMSQGGNVSRWDLRTGERKSIRPVHPEDVELRFNWNAGIAIDPFDDNTVYYGSQFVHKSIDRGDSWTIISPDLTTNNPEWQKQAESGGLTLDVTNAENFTTIITIAPSPVQQGVIWVGTDDGRVHVTRDGGQTWESVEGRVRGVPENTWVPHIEPSKYDAGTAFVVFDDHRRGNFTPYVFRVTEFGNRWQSLVTEDLWGYALVIEQDPVDQDLLFLGTEFGLFVSSNGGANWMKWKHGLPTASTIALIVHPREHDLVIGTHGLAAFVLDDIRPLRSVSTEILAQPIHLFDIPDAVQYTVKQTGASRFPGNGEFRGENRDYGALITFSLNDEDLPHPNEDIERERKAAKREATGGEEESAGEQEAGAGPGRGGRPDRGPQVKVVVTDAGGDSIAGFERPVELGVNRIAWNLRRDGFERPRAGPGGEESFFFGGGFGPDVLPGTYTVTLKYKEHEASGSVNVLPDPRYSLTVAQRREKYDALMHAGQVQETLAEAVKRLRDTRDEIDKVLSMLKEDEGGTEEPEAEAGEPEQDIRKDAAELKKKLTELEERLWMPPGTAKGIARDSSIYSRVSNAYYSMSSSWDPPTEGEQIYLRYAEQRLQAALDEINQVFADDVAEFRGSVESAGIAFLERKEPLALPER
jgi:photosystem II stability/assembly factor-like uncharacterized protein